MQRRQPDMPLRSKFVEWGWGVALALPAVALFLTGQCTGGLVSIAAFVLLFAYVLAGIGYGFSLDARIWRDMRKDFDGRDGEAEQDDES